MPYYSYVLRFHLVRPECDKQAVQQRISFTTVIGTKAQEFPTAKADQTQGIIRDNISDIKWQVLFKDN